MKDVKLRLNLKLLIFYIVALLERSLELATADDLNDNDK